MWWKKWGSVGKSCELKGGLALHKEKEEEEWEHRGSCDRCFTFDMTEAGGGEHCCCCREHESPHRLKYSRSGAHHKALRWTTWTTGCPGAPHITPPPLRGCWSLVRRKLLQTPLLWGVVYFSVFLFSCGDHKCCQTQLLHSCVFRFIFCTNWLYISRVLWICFENKLLLNCALSLNPENAQIKFSFGHRISVDFRTLELELPLRQLYSFDLEKMCKPFYMNTCFYFAQQQISGFQCIHSSFVAPAAPVNEASLIFTPF